MLLICLLFLHLVKCSTSFIKNSESMEIGLCEIRKTNIGEYLNICFSCTTKAYVIINKIDFINEKLIYYENLKLCYLKEPFNDKQNGISIFFFNYYYKF